ncbi:MAG: AraC family transcriptional regulator [Kiritimatiellia bacterium]
MSYVIELTRSRLQFWSQRLEAGKLHIAPPNPGALPPAFKGGVSHSNPEVFFQMGGENHFRFADRRMTLSPGECLWVPAGIPHAEWARDAGGKFSMLVIGFYARQLTFFHAKRGSGREPVVDHVYTVPLPHPAEFRELITVTERYLKLAPEKLGADLLCQVLKYLRDYLEDPPSEEPGGNRTTPASKAAQLLQARFMQGDCNVASIAKELGITPNYLSAQYRRETGERLSEVLIRERLQLACGLLEKTGLPVADVASRCGFRDASHFSARFRRRYGLTPLAYRRR